MEVKGIVWLGVRAERFEETANLYRDVMGLEPFLEDAESARFRLANDTEIHVYGPADTWHEFFGTAPVVGFLVDDAEQARAELQAAGIEVLTDMEREGGSTWCHFRGPDGNVYELMSRTG